MAGVAILECDDARFGEVPYKERLIRDTAPMAQLETTMSISRIVALAGGTAVLLVGIGLTTSAAATAAECGAHRAAPPSGAVSAPARASPCADSSKRKTGRQGTKADQSPKPFVLSITHVFGSGPPPLLMTVQAPGDRDGSGVPLVSPKPAPPSTRDLQLWDRAIISGAFILIMILIVCIAWFVGRVGGGQTALNIEVGKIRFAGATFTGIMVLLLYISLVYYLMDQTRSSAGKEIFEKTLTALTPLAGAIVGYLFGGASTKTLPEANEATASKTQTGQA